MNNFKCPMCTDCPKNCPLDTEEDTREYSADYYKGKLDGAREFAEWLPQHFDLRFSNNPDVWLDEFFNHTSDKILAEWQKGNQ